MELDRLLYYIWAICLIALGWLTKKLASHDQRLNDLEIEYARIEILQSEVRQDIIELKKDLKSLSYSIEDKFEKILNKLQ